MPPTRAPLRPLAAAMAAHAIARTAPLTTVTSTGAPGYGGDDYIDGEVISVVDDEATEYKPLY